jgi:hypothetical protein
VVLVAGASVRCRRGDGPAAGERPLGRPSDRRPAGCAYRGPSGAFRFLTRGSGPASRSVSRTIMADYAVEGTPSADLGWVENQEGSLGSRLLGDFRPGTSIQ